jgi:hypothetical protein
MLFQPAGDGRFHRAYEADDFQGLVAAILEEPDYETADVASRLVNRLRLADDIALIAQVHGMKLSVGDDDRAKTINATSDESFIHSLDRLGFVSLEPGWRETRRQELAGGGNE